MRLQIFGGWVRVNKYNVITYKRCKTFYNIYLNLIGTIWWRKFYNVIFWQYLCNTRYNKIYLMERCKTFNIYLNILVTVWPSPTLLRARLRRSLPLGPLLIGARLRRSLPLSPLLIGARLRRSIPLSPAMINSYSTIRWVLLRFCLVAESCWLLCRLLCWLLCRLSP